MVCLASNCAFLPMFKIALLSCLPKANAIPAPALEFVVFALEDTERVELDSALIEMDFLGSSPSGAVSSSNLEVAFPSKSTISLDS